MKIIANVLNATKVKQMLYNLKQKHAKGFENGMVKGALVVQAAAVKQTPIDLGPLRASYAGSPRQIGSGFDTNVEIACGTEYAIYVHEDLNAKHAAGTNAKFLERPARQLSDTVQKIVAKETMRG
jgi:hypothetical protein